MHFMGNFPKFTKCVQYFAKFSDTFATLRSFVARVSACLFLSVVCQLYSFFFLVTFQIARKDDENQYNGYGSHINEENNNNMQIIITQVAIVVAILAASGKKYDGTSSLFHERRSEENFWNICTDAQECGRDQFAKKVESKYCIMRWNV